MAFKQTPLWKPLNFGIIKNDKSYWASHFYAVIAFLHYHRTWEFTTTTYPQYPTWTLESLRGRLPHNFFHFQKVNIQNWGFQYFLSVFLNYKMSSNTVYELIQNLSKLYNEESLTQFLTQHVDYKFFVSGADSVLSEGLLNEFTQVFPHKIKGNHPNINLLAQYSDLCLIIDLPIPYGRLAIFGEVEGNHGHKPSNKSYWIKKLPFCIFTIVVIDGPRKGGYICTTFLNDIPRVNIIFEKTHFVVRDFHQVLNTMDILFNYGPNAPTLSADEEFDFFCNIVKKHWNKKSIDLINIIKSYCHDDDLICNIPKSIPIITNILA